MDDRNIYPNAEGPADQNAAAPVTPGYGYAPPRYTAPAYGAPQYAPRYAPPVAPPQPRYGTPSPHFSAPGSLSSETANPTAEEEAPVPSAPAPAPAAAPAPAPAKAPAKKEKKTNTALWKKIVAAAIALVVLIGSNAVTAFLMNASFKSQLKETEDDLQSQINNLDVQGGGESQNHEINKTPSDTGNPPTDPQDTPDVPQSTTGLMTPAQVYANNVESVVLIRNDLGYSGYSTGSGFFLTESGYVVTNYHVVEGNGDLSVITYAGKEYAATYVGGDDANDVALLKVQGNDLPAVKLGDSDQLIVGDQVAAIGNPLGELTSTLTVGYISAKERDVNTSGFAINMLQTDAAINSGNSGGPLFNMKGEVVGITSAKYSGSSGSGATIEGIGFAIPMNDVLPFLENLILYGKDTTPYMGVSVKDITESDAQENDVPQGAYVSEVVSGGCADKGGIRVGDIIIQLGDYKVSSVNSMTQALRHYKAGDTVDTIVYRNGDELTLSLTLDERPEEMPSQGGQNYEDEDEFEFDWFDYLFPGFGY